MKKALVLVLTLAIVIGCCAFPTSAKDDATIIYSENYNMANTVDELGMTFNSSITTNTAQYSIENGQLIIDNLDATVGTSKDSFCTFIPSDVMEQYHDVDWSLQCNLTYLAAEHSERYCAFCVDFDEGGTYYSACGIKVCGYGANQIRLSSSWSSGPYKWGCMDDPAGGYFASSLGADGDPIITKVYGEAFDKTSYAMIGRTITMRLVVSVEDGISIYLTPFEGPNANVEILVSKYGADATDMWHLLDSYALGFFTSLKVKLALDDLIVWTGTGAAPDMPRESVRPTKAEDTTTAGGEDTTVPGGENTTVPGGNTDTTPAPGNDTTPAPGNDTTPAPGDDTTPAPGDDTTPASGGNDTTKADDGKKDGGCKSAVVMPFAIIALAGAVTVIKKKKD